jgi:hypothetical protein
MMMKEIKITIKPGDFRSAYRILSVLKNENKESLELQRIQFGNDEPIEILGIDSEIDKVVNNLNKHI